MHDSPCFSRIRKRPYFICGVLAFHKEIVSPNQKKLPPSNQKKQPQHANMDLYCDSDCELSNGNRSIMAITK